MCVVKYQTRKTVCDLTITVEPKAATKGCSLVHWPNFLLQTHFQVLVFIVLSCFFFPGNEDLIIPKLITRLDSVPGRSGRGVVALSEPRVEEARNEGFRVADETGNSLLHSYISLEKKHQEVEPLRKGLKPGINGT